MTWRVVCVCFQRRSCEFGIRLCARSSGGFQLVLGVEVGSHVSSPFPVQQGEGRRDGWRMDGWMMRRRGTIEHSAKRDRVVVSTAYRVGEKGR